MFSRHPIEKSISLEHLYQSSEFFHRCKGKSMYFLEMDIIFSRFFLFLKYRIYSLILGVVPPGRCSIEAVCATSKYLQNGGSVCCCYYYRVNARLQNCVVY